MEWLRVLNANQSILDGVIESLKCQSIYIAWCGWQFQMPTILRKIESFTVFNENQSILDRDVDSFKCTPIYTAWSS